MHAGGGGREPTMQFVVGLPGATLPLQEERCGNVARQSRVRRVFFVSQRAYCSMLTVQLGLYPMSPIFIYTLCIQINTGSPSFHYFL